MAATQVIYFPSLAQIPRPAPYRPFFGGTDFSLCGVFIDSFPPVCYHYMCTESPFERAAPASPSPSRRQEKRPARFSLSSLLCSLFPLTPLFAADPKSASVTPLVSALTKSLDLKSFRICTYKKGWGGTPAETEGVCHEASNSYAYPRILLWQSLSLWQRFDCCNSIHGYQRCK